MIGAALRAGGADFFNPDEAARNMRLAKPGIRLATANLQAWEEGLTGLRAAINRGSSFTIETTLAGSTMLNEFIRGATSGMRLAVYYVGLNTVDLHIARVAARRREGGHDIPEADIRRRFEASPRNLTLLVPYVTDLTIFDNSAESHGGEPRPEVILHVEGGDLMIAPDLENLPGWAVGPAQAVQERFAD